MKLVPLVDLSALMLLQGRQTASANGTGVDVTKYDGPAIAIVTVHNVSGTTPTFDLKLTESADNSTFAALPTNLAITQVTTVDSLQVLNLGDINERKQYLRAEAVLTGTSPVYDQSVTLLTQLKYK